MATPCVTHSHSHPHPHPVLALGITSASQTFAFPACDSFMSPLALFLLPLCVSFFAVFLCFPSVLFSLLFIPFLLALRTFVASLSPAFVRFLFFSFFLRLFHVSYFTACVLRQCVQQQSTMLNGSESPPTSASPSPTHSTFDSASVSVPSSSTLMRLKRQFSWNR